jgi:predicted nucleic acid-binding protein
MRVFVDANIFIYAAGREHSAKAASVRLLREIGARHVDATTDTEVLQELLCRYRRTGAAQDGLQLCDQVLEVIGDIRPVAKADIVVARRLLAEHPAIEPRDAVHAAVMLNHGLTHLYSYDHHFDQIPGLTRLEP